MEQREENVSFSDKCAVFLMNNRKLLAILVGSVSVCVIAALLVTSFSDRAAKQASDATEALISEWVDLQAKKPEDLTEKETALITRFEEQAMKNGKTYAGFRAYSVLGEIFSVRKDWQKAMDCFEKAAVAVPTSYTAGAAYFNAAVCADELKDYEKALSFYTKTAGIEDFPLVPRALFNIGRCEEMLNHPDKALEAYAKLSEKYPDNSWALLGKSRTVILSIRS